MTKKRISCPCCSYVLDEYNTDLSFDEDELRNDYIVNLELLKAHLETEEKCMIFFEKNDLNIEEYVIVELDKMKEALEVVNADEIDEMFKDALERILAGEVISIVVRFNRDIGPDDDFCNADYIAADYFPDELRYNDKIRYELSDFQDCGSNELLYNFFKRD